ncbi:MFS transporter [Humibacter antri]
MTLTETAPPEEALTDTLDPRVKTGPVIAVLAAAGIVVSLAQTLVVPIIGSLPKIFDTAPSNTAWIITVTLLAGAIATPVAGRLGDMYGKKRMLLLSTIPFILGSVICAISTSVVPMIVGRGLQGLASGMIPLGISLLHDVLPKHKVGGAIALMSSSLGIGGALGLPIAAGVTEFADWRVLFWATGIAAALVAVAIWKIVPVREPASHARGFDYVGVAGLAIGLVALLLGVSKGSEWGWDSAGTIGCLVAGVVVFLLWGWYELRRRNPLIDLRTTAKPVVLLTNVASILVGFAMYAMNLIIPQVMELPVDLGYGLGQTMFQMGLWVAPMGIGMMAVSSLGAWISRVRGPKTTLTISGIVIAIGYGSTALILATIGSRAAGPAGDGTIVWTLILLLLGTTVTGCGIGLAYGSMPALILGAVPANAKGAANGINSLMRSIGTTASAAVIGAVLGSMATTLGGHPIPTLTGFLVTLLIGCGAALVAAGVAATIPVRTKTTSESRH